MEAKVVKFVRYIIIIFIILLSINFISEIIPEYPTRFLRRVLAIINWFIYVPLFFSSFYFIIIVIFNHKQGNLSKVEYILFSLATIYFVSRLLYLCYRILL